MCTACNIQAAGKGGSVPQSHSRRRLLGAAGLAALGSLAGLTGGVARAQSSPPRPSNVISPDQALDRLMTGNARYVKDSILQINVAEKREALSQGQNPFACIVSCADSRIGPELCFDVGRGDLFVTRVAGNFVTTDILASLEYGTAVLESPLIMVLGHTSCGALDAAVKAYTDNVAYPGHIQVLTTALAPAVRAASANASGSALVEAATIENVRLNVRKLTESNPIISERVRQGKLKIVGGMYDLPSGRVTVL